MKYRLTLKGVIIEALNFDEVKAQKVLDSIELYMRRIECNSIVFRDNEFIFTEVKWREDDK